jgi:hypothetical protein
MGDLVAVGAALIVLAALAWALYRPRVQQSQGYQATVVPLANIMDIGFIVLSPAIILLAGFTAPLVMLGISLLAIAMGFTMAYNIRNYEPLEGTDDPVNRIGHISRWALTGASVINIAYYTLLFTTIVLWPIGAYNDTSLAIVGTVLLVVLIIVGMNGGMPKLNDLGNKTTAFNLAAVSAVVVAFVVYNVQEALGGRWDVPFTNPGMDAQDFRKIIGLFAIVQGFEASRYIGSRFSSGMRISTMKVAQIISTVIFVAFLASAVLLFVGASSDVSGTAIFAAADEISPLVPWLILAAALGSEGSAIINATTSRSDMLVNHSIPRRWTFALLLIPAIVVFLFTNVSGAVAMASRVFAVYYLLQALIALIIARRARNWPVVAGTGAIGIAMGVIAIFGIST